MIWIKVAPHAVAHALYIMAKKFPLRPSHPERICWGCDRYCPADDLACGNGSSRTQHPCELFGADWWQADDGEGSVPPDMPSGRAAGE